MPSVSKSQQKAAGMALAIKKGQVPISHAKGVVKQMAKSMTKKQLHDFAATPRKRLPAKKKKK